MTRRLRTLEVLFLLFVLPALFLAACGDEDHGGPPTTTTGQLPTQPGPFGVGVQQVTFTKKSVTMATQDRTLLTDIWYPTTPDASPLDVELGGVVNAPMAAANLPLLLFSHGNCSLPTLSRFFIRALTSYGFIVAAPLHAGDLLTDPDCGINDADGIANRPADIEFVIDSLLQLNTDPASCFSGAIDPQRIGMAGHSYGGDTTLRVSASDPRVVAGLLMASPIPRIRLATIHTPVMAQGGALDSDVPFALESLIYGALGPPKYLVEILRTGHTAFLDDGCYPNGVIPSLPTPFCDAAGPDALSADAAHQFILRYAVPFLLHWVAGDDRFDAFLAPDAAPAGVIFTADTGGSSTSTPTPAP
jgi:pimeloyl-ACP methyl ester carboxylesterase